MKKLLGIIIIASLFSCNGNENDFSGSSCPEVHYNVTNNNADRDAPAQWPIAIQFTDSNSVKHTFFFTADEINSLNTRAAANTSDAW